MIHTQWVPVWYHDNAEYFTGRKSHPTWASVCMVLSYWDTIMTMAYLYLNKQNMGMVWVLDKLLSLQINIMANL